MYNRLYILVEGSADQRFFDRIIKTRFERKYGRGRFHIQQYSEKNSGFVARLIEKAKAENSDLICVADIDRAPCVSRKKYEKQQEEFRNVDAENILIVVKKIEGWYLAGLDDNGCKRFGFPLLASTDKVGQGLFKRVRRGRFGSGLDFMQEILKHFDIETAKRKNKSFGYFVNKYDL